MNCDSISLYAIWKSDLVSITYSYVSNVSYSTGGDDVIYASKIGLSTITKASHTGGGTYGNKNYVTKVTSDYVIVHHESTSNSAEWNANNTIVVWGYK